MSIIVNNCHLLTCQREREREREREKEREGEREKIWVRDFQGLEIYKGEKI